MRVLRQLGVAQDTDLTKFPDGQIQNEDESTGKEGTPVVREVYGEIITNIYAILRDAGITANGIEDNEIAGYQLLDALKQFSNNTNDLEQIISVSGAELTVGLDISVLPDKFVFIGRLSDALSNGVNYTLNDTVNLTVNKDILASSNVICILDQSGVRLIDLSSLEDENTSLHTPFGAPLSFNDTSTVYYLSKGVIMTDHPVSYNIQNSIRVSSGEFSSVVTDAIIFNGKLIVTYVFGALFDTSRVAIFDMTDLNSVVNYNVRSVGVNQYMYCDGSFVYFTNYLDGGDYAIEKNTFSGTAFNFVSNFDIDSTFVKTTNVFIKNDNLYTFTNGNLYSYPLGTGNRSLAGNYPITNGVVFSHNNIIYYSNGNFASKWNF